MAKIRKIGSFEKDQNLKRKDSKKNRTDIIFVVKLLHHKLNPFTPSIYIFILKYPYRPQGIGNLRYIA